MMRSLYSGITGLRNHQTKMDVIGNNIANVNTVGFKASRVVFSDLYSQNISSASGNSGAAAGRNPQQIGLGSSVAAIDLLFTPGAAQYTGADLDLAIDGDGFFVVRGNWDTSAATPTYEEYYTRNGRFGTDGANYLCTADGKYVVGYAVNPSTGERVTPDTEQKIFIDPANYNVEIDDKGMVTALKRSDNTRVYLGQIQMASFYNNGGLEKVGSSMYRNTVNSGAPQKTAPGTGGAAFLKSGSLEMSNVDLAQEFTELIVTQRGFQANSRTITTSDQILEELVNIKR